MSNYTHETVPTQFVEANGIRFAYRRFGKPGTIPLLFLEYFNSNMDGWDPDVTTSLAADHAVILFDNAGVGASGGKPRRRLRRWRNIALPSVERSA
jgi:pimeloyl-ACP methyl ester carboxylesterase